MAGGQTSSKEMGNSRSSVGYNQEGRGRPLVRIEAEELPVTPLTNKEKSPYFRFTEARQIMVHFHVIQCKTFTHTPGMR
ncbi:hypothetical protein PM082_022767 [Marasmius tenuissimus]|nr:hypothetical protein PM082_022767 [Marasmius tenuissimus]